jgi:hypothetical protein
MSTISIVQTAKNSSAYQVQPLTVTLPAKTTAGSYLVVVVEAQKSGSPYNFGSIGAHTPNPIITDDKGNIYTLVDDSVNNTQEVTSGLLQPDASGFFPSAYVYVSSTAAATGTQNISLAAFYPDEYTSPIQPNGNLSSPPIADGRPIFDGGIQAQVFEVANLSSGLDAHGHSISYSATLGAGIITSAVAAIIFEVGVLIDSSALTTNTNSTLQHAGIIGGGSSHYVIQTRVVSSATANTGFGNALRYTGSVVAVSLK